MTPDDDEQDQADLRKLAEAGRHGDADDKGEHGLAEHLSNLPVPDL